MTEIGKEVVKTLKIIPAKVVVEEHHYFTYACQRCNRESTETPVVKAPKEKNIISGSFATPEAIAHIMTPEVCHGLASVSSRAGTESPENSVKPTDNVQLDLESG